MIEGVSSEELRLPPYARHPISGGVIGELPKMGYRSLLEPEAAMKRGSD
jgi:hypothetical protein